ncbi:lysosomal alpha-mannosidase-like isoform X2 [Glandiceps talaboti]
MLRWHSLLAGGMNKQKMSNHLSNRLLAKMGMDGVFFARLEDADKFLRLEEKRMEGVWHGSASLGSNADLFFGALYDHYSPPEGYCYDAFCDDPPIQDNRDLFDYNVDDRVDGFLKIVSEQVKHFQTNHIMMTMGDDFEYENANEWFKNLDKLIKYVNQREDTTNVHVLYSTPACYLLSLNQANKTWTTKAEDFMPIGSPHDYWSGFYTSRPALKGYVRETSGLLQTCKQLEGLSGVPMMSSFLKDAMGIVQHHDAITGTERQHVADDYAKRLAMGTKQCQSLTVDVISQLMMKNKTVPRTNIEFCNYLNISACQLSESQNSFTVTVYNTLAYEVSHFVRIPVNGVQYIVTGPDGDDVQYQIQEVSSQTKNVRRNKGTATHQVIFPVTIPAVGFSTYTLTAKSLRKTYAVYDDISRHVTHTIDDVMIKNEHLSLSFDGNTGLLKSVSNLADDLTIPVQQSFYWYNSSTESNHYIFSPYNNTPFPLFSGTINLKHIKGNLVEEVHQEFTPWLSQVVRLYKGQKHAEFEWTVGPVPFKDGLGKEIITRFDTPLKTTAKFYTDSNGRQMMERRRNHRDSFPYLPTDPVAGNYYPINSRIYIKDDNVQLSVLTDRSHGGSSIKNGSMEIMIHRRLLYNGGGSVNEALNETGQYGDGLIVRGKHYIILEKPQNSAKIHRPLATQIFAKPTVMLSEWTTDWKSKYNTKYSSLTSDLPINAHLLTLEQWNDNKILLRLEHIFEDKEDQNLSSPVTVSLKNLLKSFDIVNIEETTLDGNLPIKDAKRLHWNIETGYKHKVPAHHGPINDALEVTLNPMQIRTFQLVINKKLQ